MSAEARGWLRYAAENLQTARLCLDAGLFNPTLQNAQQAVEKSLKAVSIRQGLALRKTHSIGELTNRLRRAGIELDLSDDESALLDAVYLPSKYPLGSVLPEFEPDRVLAEHCLALAERILRQASQTIGETAD